MARCSDRHDPCCRDCQIVTKAAVFACRPARGPCDLSEYCDGVSPDCPADLHRPDGASCSTNDGAMHCASGVCTSRDRQCQAGAARFLATAFCPVAPSSCQLNCSVPGVGCMSMAGQLIDGTRCGERGTCRQGLCIEGSPLQSGLLAIYSSLMLLVCGLFILGGITVWRWWCKALVDPLKIPQEGVSS
jgi:hypothetical protein